MNRLTDARLAELVDITATAVREPCALDLVIALRELQGARAAVRAAASAEVLCFAGIALGRVLMRSDYRDLDRYELVGRRLIEELEKASLVITRRREGST